MTEKRERVIKKQVEATLLEFELASSTEEEQVIS